MTEEQPKEVPQGEQPQEGQAPAQDKVKRGRGRGFGRGGRGQRRGPRPRKRKNGFLAQILDVLLKMV